MSAWKEERWRVEVEVELFEMQCGVGEGVQAWEMEEALCDL